MSVFPPSSEDWRSSAYILTFSVSPCRVVANHVQPPACVVAASLTALGIIFAIIFYRESLPSILSNPSRSSSTTSFALRLLSPSHARNTSMSNMSDAETLVESEPSSPAGGARERLLSKLPHGLDGPSADDRANQWGEDWENRRWGFRELMRHRPVQVMAITSFLSQFVGGAWAAVSLLFFFDRKK